MTVAYTKVVLGGSAGLGAVLDMTVFCNVVVGIEGCTTSGTLNTPKFTCLNVTVEVLVSVPPPLGVELNVLLRLTGLGTLLILELATSLTIVTRCSEACALCTAPKLTAVSTLKPALAATPNSMLCELSIMLSVTV